MMRAFVELCEPKAAGECPVIEVRGSVASK
jgi:hypothetical protein